MELIAYIRLFRRWWWLIVLSAFLAGGASYLYTSRQPEQYQAWASLSVGSVIEVPDPQSSELSIGQDLAQTYAVIAKYYDTLEATVESGGFPVTPSQLGNALSTEIVPQTSLLILRVTYTDPVLAAEMANELAQQLIANSPTNLTVDQQSQIDLANAEVERLNGELAQLRLQMSNIDSQLASTTDAEERAELQEQRNSLVSQINQASGTIADFTSTIASLQRRVNSLDIVQPARTPSSPIGSNTMSRTLLAAMVGAALAGGVVLLIEYLDNTVKSPHEISQALGMATLATIPEFGKKRDSYQERLITYLEPMSPISEQYRMLRTNLLFSTNGNFRRSYVISSPGPTEGKSVVTSNLATTLAMAGFRVLLIDADLRRPRIHEIFDLENQFGLSTLLNLSSDEIDAQVNGPDTRQTIDGYLQHTQIPGLRVLTSGASPLNPTEVLGSAAMRMWDEKFQTEWDMDVILYDSPPVLVVADAAILAASLEAPMLAVFHAGSTRIGAAQRFKETVEQLDVTIAGAVLNAISKRDQDYYGYEYYYYHQ